MSSKGLWANVFSNAEKLALQDLVVAQTQYAEAALADYTTTGTEVIVPGGSVTLLYPGGSVTRVYIAHLCGYVSANAAADAAFEVQTLRMRFNLTGAASQQTDAQVQKDIILAGNNNAVLGAKMPFGAVFAFTVNQLAAASVVIGVYAQRTLSAAATDCTWKGMTLWAMKL